MAKISAGCLFLKVSRLLFAFVLLTVYSGAFARTTLLMPLDKEASWKDIAFLAAVPAACMANSGNPSLISLDDSLKVGPEIQDYIKRYRPERVYVLNNGTLDASMTQSLPQKPGALKLIRMESADQAAVELSRTFWKSSRSVIVCRVSDYGSALMGTSVASLLQSPLLFADERGLSKAALNELKRLKAKRIVFIGADSPRLAGETISLDGPIQVMEWVRKSGFQVKYLAAVNPLDRENYVIRKLSLSGAELAAGRRGLVAPLRFAVQWKQAFNSSALKGELPAGISASSAPAKSGTIDIGSSKFPFILTGAPQEQDLRIYIDLKGDGHYSSAYASGDQVDLGGKRWAVSLGTRTKFGKTDVHVTWPTADRLCQELRTYYLSLGRPPENLCLVGFPDALPQAIIGHGGIVEEQTSDLPYGFAGETKFATIGVGRVIAENASLGTLYAARALTYNDLLNDAWSKTATQAAWENTYQPVFDNYGFNATYQHTGDKIAWTVPPTNGKGGTRAPSFAQGSPLAQCSVLAHADHSWWRELGATIKWDAEVLMAPTVVESGGCGTACLDREPDYRTVVARLLRQGAIAFAGATREQPAEAQPVRDEFWNGVLAGETLGQAHKRALNSGLLTIFDQKENAEGAYRYSTNIRMLFGDPGLQIKVPAKPKSAPAKTTLTGDTVSVYAPTQWWIVKIIVPPDWKAWAGKDLFAVRGAGAYAMSDWCGEGYDLEVSLVTAQFTTPKRVKEIKQVQTPAKPLGWKGTWYEDKNANGTYTYRFAVRMVDFDQIKGKIVSSVDRLDYRLAFE